MKLDKKSVDARSSSIEEARHKPGPWLEGRSSLKISSDSSSGRQKRQINFHLNSTTTSNFDSISEQLDNYEHKQERISPINDDWFYMKTITSKRAKRGTSLHKLKSNQATRRLMKRNYHFPQLEDYNKEETSASNLNDQLYRFSSIWSKFNPFNQEPSSSFLPTPMALTSSSSSRSNNEQQLVAHLQIDSLSSEDNGLYSCRVDFRKARSRTQESILSIVGEYCFLYT